MSDWEDFCESNGWNAGSADDYDKFLDSLEDRPRRGTQTSYQSANLKDGLYFSTFREATDWAKNNPGKSIARSTDGQGFVAKK